jgi:peptide/nickel transport system substrate-binding protein/microcin C transport system substrate-binding protein
MLSLMKIILSAFLILGSANIMAANSKAPLGGVFKYNLGQAPTTLNALSSSDLYASKVQGWIMEGLATRDGDTYEWKPSLAKSWKISKDGMTFTFVIREGVKWHDGKPLTIEDVKFSFDAILHPENKYKTAHLRSFYENISEAKILDKNTIQFKAKKVYFRNFDVVAGLTVVPKHLYENPSKKQKKKLNKTLIGTGAYKLSKFKRGKGITLVRNKKWWGDKVAHLKGTANYNKVLMRFVKDSNIALQRLERGDLDYQDLRAEDFVKKTNGAKWGKSVFKNKVQNKAPVSYGFIGWNLKNELFKDKQVRKALYHLVNRELMIKKFLFGFSMPATGPLYQQSEYANHGVKAVKFDPKKALEMLRKQGWKDTDGDLILDKVINGKKKNFSFTILEPNDQFVKYLTIFKEDAKKAGIEVKIKVIEWNSFIKKLDERSFEAVRLGWGGGSVDWDPKQIWHSDSIKGAGSNFVSYSNPTVDKLIDEARVTMNKKKRTKILNKVFKTIADDAPYAFFFNSKFLFYGNSKRMGKEKDTYQYEVGYGNWWITK